MPQIYPYLHFDGDCREAMSFYKDCLGGELSMQTVGESPMASRMPPSSQKNILHSTLKIAGGATLMASDRMDSSAPQKGNDISLSLVFGSKAETEAAFAKMSAGGNVPHPLKEEFFGMHGNLRDKYGISWMFTFETPRK